MVQDSVRFLRAAGMRVFFDAEHCFDGYKANPEYVLRVLEAAVIEGAECIVLCDTNGGSLPHEVQQITSEVVAHFGDDVQVGIHTQNDSGCAVANSIAAVVGGATQLQGTVNGYGERTGNANLMTCIPNLELKMGIPCLPEGNIARLTAVSRHISELVNLPPHAADPYVGTSAFAHKGGLHTSALGKAGNKSYEHVDPAAVGQPHPCAGQRPRRPGRHADEGRGVRHHPRRPGVGRAGAGGSTTWRPGATSSRPPTRRSSCSCGVPPAGSRTTSTSSPTA